MQTEQKYKSVNIVLDGLVLKGNLAVPKNAIGMVIFSHGSGSSRLSPRNNYVAEVLQEKGLATLLFDLLTKDEDHIYENRFNIDLLTMRLIDVTKWVQRQKETKGLAIGYFGASTGAASALRAAAFYGKDIKAVVSRGGRPDMALQDLHKVTAPTLLIVGGWDDAVIELNEKAYQKLKSERKLEIVPMATHLFEESGKLEKVAHISANWFAKYLQPEKIKQDV
ncbi:Alpha/beta hydrolase family protein [Maribacter orientalis]|uniref:Alpha/beta hydrolase family protein n=1 Tax=Maribacter orientalis TaxID=228957 RepID=A0A1H7RS16_9FLAO|nr:alpha/beta family hydrolase [Maribacter orientalis]SEL63013.1 Alpha/beta hydrolase family protein [Maribacter orientalis]|tara:strand:+ start:277 stop:945 length:669 start_codon:yes stop_codon:yes gene_type:complete